MDSGESVRKMLVGVIKRTPLYHPLRNRLQIYRQADELKQWGARDFLPPIPHVIKQRALKEYSDRYGLRILIETGTYLGDMVEAMKGSFDGVYSIELSRNLCDMARARFSRDSNVEIMHGDSGKELGKLMGKISQPALFWLDGHYSGGPTARGEKDCPIIEEIDSIANERVLRHVIIIDDARCFGVDPQYPSIGELAKHVSSKWNNAEIAVLHDSIRITPR